jgi:transcription antitermination factor NusG
VSVQGLQGNLLSEFIELSRLGIEAPCDNVSSSSCWYALYVRSHHERVVESALKGKGYIAFSPFYRTKRKRVDRTVEIEVPLFPGYVFCRFDASRRLPILVTPGIVELVPANRPEPIDDAEISSIQTLAMSGLPVQPWPFLTSGHRIRLNAGPLVGAEGTFLRIKDKYHLVVSVSLLQRAVSVVIEKDSVEPIFRDQHVVNSQQM